jgi:hypothetical protein
MKAAVKNDRLYLELDLISPARLSSTGKAYLVASESKREVVIDGKSCTIQVNAYFKA